MSLPFLVAIVLVARVAPGADWTLINSPNANDQANELRGVSAAADNDAWAVGTVYADNTFTKSRTLIEHWDGTRWSVVKSPNTNASINILEAIAAVTANDIWAVGVGITGFSTTPLIEHWNGIAWSIVANRGTTVGGLGGVAVVSANDVWAVGTGRAGDEDSTLILHWNGAAWSLVPSPNVGPEVDNGLAAVTAIASDDVWAVGTQQPTSLTAPHTLTLHWDGTAWSIVPSANTRQTSGNHLLAVAAVASDDVWATGFTPSIALAEHWDGNSWSLVSTPLITGASSPSVSGAVALANGDVWAVGQFFQNSQSRSRTLTELWNGSSWSVVSSPNRGPSHNFLNAVTATPSGTLWAVGVVYNNQFIERTLILQKLP
ncbi:MAG: hypothetical protein DMG88_22495 [Acidobacteria bacterium]|nr:MAG: hypothetical protein DMG88_22495 [Acidobacteriota bacterium]